MEKLGDRRGVPDVSLRSEGKHAAHLPVRCEKISENVPSVPEFSEFSNGGCAGGRVSIEELKTMQNRS